MDRTALRKEIVAELEGNLLPFWRERVVDGESGGFIGEMSADGVVRPGAPHGLILNSRLLWTFSALVNELGDERDLTLARRAFDVLDERFRDRENGGYHWMVGADGRPLDSSKKVYGHGFCVYALAEYHRATGDEKAIERVDEVLRLIENHAVDEVNGGYLEARDADWSPAGDLRLSAKDMDAPKSMNNHLHVLEAFTNLERVRPTDTGRERLYELVEIFGRHILTADDHGMRLQHFFDESWAPLDDSRTYGHDIEAAWLLGEAAEVLGDAHLQSRVDVWSVDLARSVIATGVDADGAIAFEGRGGEVINPHRDWWCQAEAVVGFQHVFELTGERAFAEASERAWRFIERRVVDRIRGEWFRTVRADNSVVGSAAKVSLWKGPYHNVRMCLEMRRRLGAVDGELV